MKKLRMLFWAAVLSVIISAAALPAQAADHPDEPYYITGYNVQMDVAEDNSFTITETIDVYFNESRHGIYRRIPTENRVERADGSVDYTKAKVTKIRCSERYEKSYGSGSITLKIGDPDETITGYMQYVISYKYSLGQDVADGYDELYFNIIGDGWDTYIDNVSFEITMPKEFEYDEELLGFSTGSYGFVGTDSVLYYVDGLTIGGYLIEELAPYEAFTIRLVLEDGYFYFDQVLHMVKVVSIAVFPFLALVFAFVVWLKFGREKRLVTTVEFYPPEGMDSADVSYWYNGKIKRKDIIAILIELANDGYVAIHEGGGKKSDYSIERVKEYPPELDDNKRIFFDGLFETGKSVVTSKDLENRFYHTLNCIASRYRASSDATRINTLLSDRLQLVCWVVSILCLVASYMILNRTFGGAERFIAFAVGIALNLISVIVSRYVPRRTDKSHANLEKITSFKNFLNTAEKSRLEQLVLENPKYFYNILPYAYVLGVSDKWVSKFEGIAIEPPDWYVGTAAGAVTAVAVWGSMSRTLNNAASSMTSAPAQSSSSSSSGGGGVSGGGSGGGGGGSW